MSSSSEQKMLELVAQAERFCEKRDYDSALGIAQELMNKWPESALSLYVRGRSYWGLKNYKRALVDLDAALHIDSSFHKAHSYRGNVLDKLKRYEEALVCYDCAIELDPQYAEAYNSKGITLDKLKRYEEALVCYDRAIELDPQYAPAYISKGITLDKIKSYRESLMYYDRAIELDPQYAPAYISKGITLDKIRHYEEALACYDRAIELDPQYASVYNSKGITLKELKQYKKALEYLSIAIEKGITENYSRPYYTRALVYEEMGQFEEALKDYERYLELRPEDMMAHFRYSSLLQRLGWEAEHEASTNSLPTSDLMLQNSTTATMDLSEEETEDATAKAKQIAASAMKRFEAEEERQPDPRFGKYFENDMPFETFQQLMEKLHANKRHEQLAKKVEENTSKFKQFTVDERRPPVDQPEFFVLRRWNSYTPIVAKNHSHSKGGGYFIHLGAHGIVIDPGFNFIENFQDHGFGFSQIDKIFITHAHNDHAADLESIRTLLYIYNKDLKRNIRAKLKDKALNVEYPDQESMDENKLLQQVQAELKQLFQQERKVIDIYLTASTFKKYAADLKLSQDEEYRIHLITIDTAGIDCSCGGEHNLWIRTIPAKHFDLLSDCDAVGFVVEFERLALIYTGDTGFSWKIGRHYQAMREEYSNMQPPKPVALLAHIGGFKKEERDYRDTERIKDGRAFYKDHLGRNGLICLTEILQPKFCIISEFGEEFHGYRIQLADQFTKVFESRNIPFLPADIGLCIRADGHIRTICEVQLSNHTITLNRNFIPIEDVRPISLCNDSVVEYVTRQEYPDDDQRYKWQIEKIREILDRLHSPS